MLSPDTETEAGQRLQPLKALMFEEFAALTRRELV